MQVLSQAKAKQIRALHQKKERMATGLFLVEGAKSVLETLKSNWEIAFLLGTTEFFNQNVQATERFSSVAYVAEKAELAKLSTFQSNDSALAVVRKKDLKSEPDPEAPLWLVLDGLADPGNLGTIIRVADWYGLTEIICLGDGVEWHNPKVISSTMGSFLRIQPIFMTMDSLKAIKDRPLLAADMEGSSLFQFQFPDRSTLLIGNEAHGLSPEVLKICANRISIPRFGQAESLNAAMATGILLNHWRSRL
ncbi:MAG TPA: RNA methyltransferase [Catalimonadaceae bacterium]|nr:RNA methyltransferase [Catalimonadaceae bacterium]